MSTVAFVKSTPCAFANATSVSTTGTFQTVSGHAVVISIESLAPYQQAPTDNFGNTWVLAASHGQPPFGPKTAQYFCASIDGSDNHGGANHVFTAHTSIASSNQLSAAEYSHVGTFSVDVTAGQSTSGLAHNSGASGPTTQANELWQGCGASNASGGTLTADSPWIQDQTNGAMITGYQIPSATSGGVTFAWHSTLSMSPDSLIVCYKDVVPPIVVTCTLGATTMVGLSGSVVTGTTIACTLGTTTMAGLGATIAQATTVNCGLGATAMAGLSATVTATQTVSAILVDSNDVPRANLTGLFWQVQDSFGGPIVGHGSGETTDGSGLISIPVTGSTKGSGSNIWLDVNNSDGTLTQSPPHKMYSGPAVIT